MEDPESYVDGKRWGWALQRILNLVWTGDGGGGGKGMTAQGPVDSRLSCAIEADCPA